MYKNLFNRELTPEEKAKKATIKVRGDGYQILKSILLNEDSTAKQPGLDGFAMPSSGPLTVRVLEEEFDTFKCPTEIDVNGIKVPVEKVKVRDPDFLILNERDRKKADEILKNREIKRQKRKAIAEPQEIVSPEEDRNMGPSKRR